MSVIDPPAPVATVSAGSRRRVAVPLLVRSVPLAPALIGCGLAIALVAGRAVLTDESVLDTFPIAVLLTAAGAGFALDDVAADVIGASPTTLARRRLIRVGLVALATAATWLVIALAAVNNRPYEPFEVRDLAVEVGVLVSVGLGTSAAANLRDAGHGPGGGPVAACVVILVPLVVSALAFRVPQYLPTLVAGSPHHERWLWPGAAGLAVLWHASRDPARVPRAGRSVAA